MAQPALDHLILFLPCSPTNTPLVPSSISNNFTLTPGGTHADGLTSNTLIILADGCYIELISFLPKDASLIASHWWGPDPNRKGWIDWCLTTSTSPSSNYEKLKDRYQQPINGARMRPDGQEVKWSVTFPKGEDGGQSVRGKVPFFCHDITPRTLRVPLDAEKTAHPSGVLGVLEICVLVKDKQALDTLVSQYTPIFGGARDLDTGNSEVEGKGFNAGRVVSAEGLGIEYYPSINIYTPRDEDEKTRVREKGYWFGNVVLAARIKEAKSKGQRERIDIGRDDIGGLWVEYV
ncbi:hypothetical protein CC78DRAFT_535243 [Lojkania enalia]|uniref:Glyoxalase-like domain-containing protein n=1 Tax=Lojkania enalia TaxID=147567 RepID=A0A9P4K670_9PLEO|nr:hypothetical protein CC78DRAFT_535243 [Didymosphaeria enalia]